MAGAACPSAPRRCRSCARPPRSRPARTAAASSTGRTSPLAGPDVTVYTDGACTGNPGPGGWAAIVLDDGPERIVSGAEPHTTNQRMELTAAIEGLAAVEGHRRVHLCSDSAYVVNCFLQRWWERWEQQGWRGAARQPVANRDLWERLLAQTRRHDVLWRKVQGHSGDPMNDRADLLARRAIVTPGAR